MNRVVNFLLIFCINAALTYAYINFVVGTFDVNELWNEHGTDHSSTNFLYDMMQYNLGASVVSIEEAVIRLAAGSTGIHAVILGLMFESDTLYSGILVNSFFVALTFQLFYRNVITSLLLYITLAPFFLYYSVGWTKEIILTLAYIFFLSSSQTNSRVHLYISFIVSLLSRPQFTPLFIVSALTKNITKKRIIFFILMVIAVSPIWLGIMPSAYVDSAGVYYNENGGQGMSVYTDFLKTNVPVFSIFGYLAAVIKLYYEPLSALFYSIYDVYPLIEFYVQIVFLITLIRSRFVLFENSAIFNIFIFTNIFISSLPFTHFRYLLPLLVTAIIYSVSVAPCREKLK